mgnify:CR=1 FL=1
MYFNDFESEQKVWSVGDTTDDAITGIWEHGTPKEVISYNKNEKGVIIQPGSDHSANGTKCMFTGGGDTYPGDNDVDNGTTSLISPILDLYDEIGDAIRKENFPQSMYPTDRNVVKTKFSDSLFYHIQKNLLIP